MLHDVVSTYRLRAGLRYLLRRRSPFRVLSQAIRNIEPRCLVRSPDVRNGSYARIIIQRSDAHDHIRCVIPSRDQMRTAARTEKALLAGLGLRGRCRFKRSHAIFAARPAKMLATHASGRRKRRRVRFLTSATVAVSDRPKLAGHFVVNVAA